MYPTHYDTEVRPKSMTYWAINQWDRPSQTSNLDPTLTGLRLRLTDDGRGYSHNFNPHRMGGGNANLFYPHPELDPSKDVLDSIRAQVMRDGIEDYLYFFAINETPCSEERDDLLAEIQAQIFAQRRMYAATWTLSDSYVDRACLESLRDKMSLFLHTH